MEKAFEIQKQARENVKTLQTYLTDLQNWETEMKRKEASRNGDFDQILPPVRSTLKKEKPVVVKKKPEKRIKSSDYSSWEKFDVDKACEEVDMADIGPVSLDSKKSVEAKKEKLREEAQYEKQRGNVFVKQEKWDEAISCYSRAIELIKDDAIYYANRGLCHLMKDSLHQAISDCNEALKLDPTYVKALQRRASASERLGSLRAASQDLTQVIKLEPQNVAARQQLEQIKKRMGTKGSKAKSSPISTPVTESNPMISNTDYKPKIIELSSEPNDVPLTNVEKWKMGIGEDITVITPVKKPPHLRSKRALKNIPIQEIALGRTKVEQNTPITKIEVIENDKNLKLNEMCKGDVSPPESVKLLTDVLDNEKVTKPLLAPHNSVQFISEWKYLKDKDGARGDYLSIIDPKNIPSIFANALESNILSEILHTLHEEKAKFKANTVGAYLGALTAVKRFSTLTLFLSSSDKDILNNLLEYCKTDEELGENEITELKKKYEL